MELDTLITYVLLFLFFVLPSILKRKKKKSRVKTPAKKKPSLVPGKIREALQEFVREMERQAREAKNKAGKVDAGSGAEDSGSVWDRLRDEEPEPFEVEEPLEEKGTGRISEATDEVTKAEPEPVFAAEKAFTERAGKREEGSEDDLLYETERPGIRLPSHSLQQAVVWSEILGKPVALRKDGTSPF